MTTILKQHTPGSYNKNVYCVNQFAFIWYFFHNCSFNNFGTIIFEKIWKNIDLNGDVTRWRKILSSDCGGTVKDQKSMHIHAVLSQPSNVCIHKVVMYMKV